MGRNLKPAPTFNLDERLILLQHLYLEAGLPPRAAIRAARADLTLDFDVFRGEESP